MIFCDLYKTYKMIQTHTNTRAQFRAMVKGICVQFEENDMNTRQNRRNETKIAHAAIEITITSTHIQKQLNFYIIKLKLCSRFFTTKIAKCK